MTECHTQLKALRQDDKLSLLFNTTRSQHCSPMALSRVGGTGIAAQRNCMRLFVAALFLIVALPASAETTGINFFTLDSITSGDVSLPERLGTALSDTDHLINRADCHLYLGIVESSVCDSTSTDAGTTDDGTTDDVGTTDDGTTDDGTTDDGTTDDVGTTDAETTDDVGTTDAGTTDDVGTTDGGAICVVGEQKCESCLILTCNSDGLSFDGGVSCADVTVACTPLDCGDSCACNQCLDGETCNSNSQCEAAGAPKPEGRSPEEGEADSGETDTTDGTDGTDGTDTPVLSGDNKLTLTVSMSSEYSGSEFRVAVGSACPTSDFPDIDSTSCTTVYTDSNLDKVTQIAVSIKMTDLLGTECSDEGEISVWFYAKSNDITPIAVSQVIFERDYTLPGSPTISSVDAGESNLKVSWDDSTSEAETTYTVYYSQQSFDSDDIAAGNVSNKTGITVTEDYQLEGLDNNITYYVGVAAVDRFDNQSAICSNNDLGEGKPILVDDFFEYYKGQGGQEEGGFCFVATAAWGSGLAPSVKQLQAFRDSQLLQGEGGRALVNLYYMVGPHAAEKVAQNERLRAVARALLAPLVLVSGQPMWGWLFIGLLLAGGRFLIRRNRRKGAQS